MPSSLIVAALTVAWLVVLVPMIAQRRQEVVRTADSALAARVLHRGGARSEISEARPMSNDELDGATIDDETGRRSNRDDQDTDVHDGFDLDDGLIHADADVDSARPGRARRYRPGRGGFDPEAAELAARARYGFRQRTVLALLAVALASAILALLITPMLWWLHVIADLAVVGYLTYLRRQVRIEEEVRQRRAARLVARVEPEAERHVDEDIDGEPVAQPSEPLPRATPPPLRHPTAVVVDADDEDPAFEDLDATLPTYRRAAGQ